MSRLDFVPGKKELQVNLEKGTLTFTPVPSRRIDVRELVKRIENAGYKVPAVKGTIVGRLTKWKEFTALEVQGTGQLFVLHDTDTTRQMLGQFGPGATVRISGEISYHMDVPESIAVIRYGKL